MAAGPNTTSERPPLCLAGYGEAGIGLEFNLEAAVAADELR